MWLQDIAVHFNVILKDVILLSSSTVLRALDFWRVRVNLIWTSGVVSVAPSKVSISTVHTVSCCADQQVTISGLDRRETRKHRVQRKLCLGREVSPRLFGTCPRTLLLVEFADGGGEVHHLTRTIGAHLKTPCVVYSNCGGYRSGYMELANHLIGRTGQRTFPSAVAIGQH